MKHSVFSKVKGERLKAKGGWHQMMLNAVAFSLFFCMASCVHHEELEFRGKVIDMRQCDFSYLDQNPGYMVQLEYPEGVGGSITEGNNTGDNLVVLYEPDRHIMVGDTIYGLFYLDPKYSKSNCSVHWDYELPEGVFTKVRVQK